MALTSTIVPYDPGWVAEYQTESSRLMPLFGANLLEICHVGSTAIPGLSGKPEIDILVEIKKDADYAVQLGSLGYRQGGDLSPGHHFFKKDSNGIRTHKIHVCKQGHPKIRELKLFLGYLRQNVEIRKEYEKLKLSLEETNTLGIAQYLAGKAPFIQRVIAQAEKAGVFADPLRSDGTENAQKPKITAPQSVKP